MDTHLLMDIPLHPAIALHTSLSEDDTFTVSMFCREDRSWLHTNLNSFDDVLAFYRAFAN